jgi:outer membrane protein assembly factor BamB
VSGNTAFVTAEPNRLVAVDLSTGRVRWDRATSVVDTLDPAYAGPIRDMVAAAAGWDKELPELKTRYAALLRAARAGDPTADPATLTALQARISELTSSLESVKPYRTPSTHDEVGYASPTPVTDGVHVWVTFGNGVVASFTVGGERRWSRWLGPCDMSKRGYMGMDAASPALVAGVLAVPYRKLTGLDPATGANRWVGPAWPHYGSPTVTWAAGRWLILSPDGLAVDASSGGVVFRGLGDVNYTSPVAVGDRVYYLGTNARYDEVAPNWALGWQLTAGGAVPLFKVEIPTRDRLYSVPVAVGDRLFAVTRQKQLVVLDANTGATLHQAAVAEGYGEVWAPLVAAGGRVWVSTVAGSIYAVEAGGGYGVVGSYKVSQNASTPWFQGSTVLWRGADALYRFGL